MNEESLVSRAALEEGIPCFEPLRSDLLCAFSLVVRWVAHPGPVHLADPSVTSLQLLLVLLEETSSAPLQVAQGKVRVSPGKTCTLAGFEAARSREG